MIIRIASGRTLERYRGAFPRWYRVLTVAVMTVAGIAAAVLSRHLAG